jgi:anti-sigma factor RsiW
MGALPASADHVDPERLAAHAAGELSAEESLAVSGHLASCADGSCLEILRDVVAGEALAREVLYGAPREEVTDPAFRVPQPSTHAVACDPTLWEMFEALARDEGCSTDFLINEAMRAYAQARSRSRPVAPRDVTVRESAPTPWPRERNTPTLQRSYLPRAPASSRRSSPYPPPPSSGALRLAVVVEGVRYEVNKDRFVVGRGGRSSDLAIDDPGVSRQHALIEHAGGTYWLVDMGSTNGIEFEGERIARRQISHGDRFRICDHELTFLLH